MTKHIRLIEELANNAWAATQTQIYDGWLLRFSGGYTRRANSVQALYPHQLPLDEKIAYCEKVYWDRGLPARFKITEAVQPTDLDDQLAEHGYVAAAHTAIMVRSLEDFDIDAANVEEVTADTSPGTAWLNLYYQANDVEVAHYGTARRLISENRLMPTHFITVWDGTTPAGVAMLTIERGYAGVFDVAVASEQRGKGYGKRLMNDVLGFARQHGAHSAYLQVMHENKVAWSLYEGLGFKAMYDHWYRQKPIPEN